MRNLMRHVTQKCFVTGLFALLLAACASQAPVAVQDVSAGMTPQQVKEILGAPADKSFEGSVEKWIYPQADGGQKVLLFRAGKLTSLGSEKDGKPVGASVTPLTSANAGGTLCVGTNDYGSYMEGGGCNMYGCWPKGGYCNGFGCSATGRCTQGGCPKKIDSFQCNQ